MYNKLQEASFVIFFFEEHIFLVLEKVFVRKNFNYENRPAE